jgi:AraC-like DNA-binding protein
LKIIKRLHKPQSVFFSWLLSYALIMIITLIISVFAYWESGKVIRYETDRASGASLKQLQQVLDGRLSDIQRMSVEVSLNSRINALVYAKEPIRASDRLEFAKIIGDLKNYKIANSFIDKFYIYFKNGSFVLSSDARYDAKDFYDFYYKDFAIDSEQWLELVNAKHPLDYVPLALKPVNGAAKNNIAFMQSLPMTQRNVNSATLVVEMNEEAIRSAIEGLQWLSRGDVIIEDKNNHIFATTRSGSLPDALLYENLNRSEAVFDSRIDNENMVVTYIKSGIADIMYISVIPESIFLERADYAYRIFYICAILCLIIGGLIAYILTRVNYNPVHKLVSIVNSKSGAFKRYRYNEYDLIEKSIMDIMKEKERVYSKLDQQKEVLKNNFLARALKGKLDGSISFPDTYKSYGLELIGDSFLVILFYVEDFNDLYLEKWTEDQTTDGTLSVIHYSMKNALEELMDQNKYSGVVTVLDDMPVCLVNFKEDPENKVKQEWVKTVTAAKDQLRQKSGIYFTASISDVHEGTVGIARAYQEAIEALEYKMLGGSNQILLYEEIKTAGEHADKPSGNASAELQFMKCMRVGDFKSARELLDGIFEVRFAGAVPSIHIAKIRMFSLIGVMINAIDEISGSMENKFLESLDLPNALLNCKTTKELHGRMLLILEKMETYFAEKKGNENSSVMNEILDTIRREYANPELSVSMIAEKLGMSVVNLSKFFKKHSGVGMLDYIHKLRIEKAKIFINSSDMTIREIGEKVGYYNSAAFIRVFKKYEGITPKRHKGISD